MTEYIGTWNWSGNPPPPDNAGQFASDSRNWSGATVLSFWPVDTAGDDATALFQAMVAGDTIRAEQASNTNNWRLWNVTGAPTLVGQPNGTWDVPVESAGSGGSNVSGGQSCNVVLTVASVPAGVPTIVATIEMNPSITLERYNAFYTALQAFIAKYDHLMLNAKYDTTAPTITTIPVLIGGASPQSRMADTFDLSNLAIPDPRPKEVVLAPPGQTSVVQHVTTTAEVDDFRSAQGV